MVNKKAAYKLEKDLPETIALIALVLGFVIALSAKSAFISYVLALLTGGMFGRLFYKIRKKPKAPITFITIVFLIGLLLGTFYAERKIMFVLFLLGIAASYYLHERKIIHSVEY